MSASDLAAVQARRHFLAEELARYERSRAELLAEDQELEVTQRVLSRLSALYCRQTEIEPVPDAYADARNRTTSAQVIDRTTNALRGWADSGAANVRNLFDKIRAKAEKRP